MARYKTEIEYSAYDTIDRIDVSRTGDGTLATCLQFEAEQEVHEKSVWLDRDVQALRELVLAEPGLKSRTDKAFLLTFLRARKFDYDRAMNMIRSYYGSRCDNPDIYLNLKPSSVNHIWSKNLQTVLSKPDYKGRTVLIFNTENWLPETEPMEDLAKAQILLLEHIVRLPLTQIKGITTVVDCRGLTLSHAYYLTPAYIKRMVSIVQEVFPLRFKALHFVHEPAAFEWIFSLLKPFLTNTIKNRLHFHGDNLTELHAHIPSSILPEELGGQSGKMDNTRIVGLLHVNEDYFIEHFSYGYLVSDEPKSGPRSSQSQNPVFESVANVGSMVGNYYRRICIDSYLKNGES